MDSFRSIGARTSRATRFFEVPNLYPIVDEHAKAIQDIHRHVRANIEEAKRLYHSTDSLNNDEERRWIESVLTDTEEALRGIAQARMIESIQFEKSNSPGVRLGKKAIRMFESGAKRRDKLARLSTCHQSLTAVISCLHQKSSMATVSVQLEKKVEPLPAYDLQLEQLFNWRDRRRREKSSISLEQERAATPTFITSGTPQPSKDSTQFSALTDSRKSDLDTTRIMVVGPKSASLSLRRGNSSDLSSLGELWEGSGRHNILETLMMPPCPPFLGRPRASSLPPCQNSQQLSRPRTSYPMSPSDYSMGSPFELRIRPLKSSLSTAVMTSSEDLRKDNEKSRECYTVHSSGQLSESHHQQDEDIHNDVANQSFEGSDGLQLVEGVSPVYLPYRSPYLSHSASSICLSLPSRPSSSYHAGRDSSLDLPRLSTNVDSIQQQSIAELGINSPETAEQPLEDMQCQSTFEKHPRKSTQQAKAGRRRRGKSWLNFHAARGDLGRSGY